MLHDMQEDGHSSKERRQGGERRRRRRYRFHDQRSGFDRRADSARPGLLQRALIALRDRPKSLQRLLVCVNLLNVADFLFTLIALESGGREVNPVLRPLFMLGPMWAGVFKLVFVLAATLLVWLLRRYRKALILAMFMLALFGALMLYHLVALVLLQTRPPVLR